jgi:hypothetical protein
LRHYNARDLFGPGLGHHIISPKQVVHQVTINWKHFPSHYGASQSDYKSCVLQQIIGEEALISMMKLGL